MTNQYKRIVVAVDGSKTAEHAFYKALDVAQRNAGATLFIVHVIDTSSANMFDYLYQNMYDLVHEHAKVLLDSYELAANEAGFTAVEKIIVKGTPKAVLTKQLGELAQADLIVCGKTGVGQVEQLFIGSTTEAIVRHATCDVLVVQD